eukprot:10860357-Alexandrium_andersonii.AAC.1
MSASLVGSEMCIRDRLLFLRGDWAEFSTTLAFPTFSSKAHPCILCKATSVSYTHLTLPTICSV